MRRKILFGIVGAVLLIGVGCASWYVHYVGYPHVIEGRWVRPRVMQWYWTGVPGWAYPGEVQYGYFGPDGRFVQHGPYVRRVWNATPSREHLQVDETGYYTGGEKNGVFTKYQTYWGRPLSRQYYERGKLVRQESFNSVPEEFLNDHPKADRGAKR